MLEETFGLQLAVYLILLAIFTTIFYFGTGFARKRMKDSIVVSNGVAAICFTLMMLWILPELWGYTASYPDAVTLVNVLIAIVDYFVLLEERERPQRIKESTRRRTRTGRV